MKKAITFGVWMLILLVYTSFIQIAKPTETKKNHCTGYSVIDAHTVQWCDGKIERKDWQIRIGK